MKSSLTTPCSIDLKSHSGYDTFTKEGRFLTKYEGCDNMKIEKVNDHQIRCTLTGDDLANRELKISELAYGSEKAKSLFRDMMQQANFEFGFDAEDIPLMIEAIPINADCIVLIITKVEDPDELDTRFSNFSPQASDDEEDENTPFPSDIADDVLDLFHKIKNSAQNRIAAQAEVTEPNEKTDDNALLPRELVSDNLSHLCRFAKQIDGFYTSGSTLYKNADKQTYHLFLSKEELDTQTFGRILNTASEFGHVQKVSLPKQAFMQEHYSVLIENDAVHVLAQI